MTQAQLMQCNRRFISPVIFFVLLALQFFTPTVEALIEDERVAEYHARNHTWPPKIDEWNPSTPGWGKLMDRRRMQIEGHVLDSSEKYNGWTSLVYTGLVAPNFTEFGYGLSHAPKHLVDELKNILHEGIAKEERKINQEHKVACIDNDIKGNEPYFINAGGLKGGANRRALMGLLPYAEAWSGKKLTPNNAYGLRVYRNTSNLHMHVDKSNTHVVSIILHVDHDNDEGSEPWPIVIESFDGNTAEVALESGDMLFYESSKCMHGRPRKFKGRFYSSLFTHYYPADWEGDNIVLDTHYRIPPTWNENTHVSNQVEHIKVIETAMTEPTCKDTWCAMNKGTLKFSGPVEVGTYTDASGTHELDMNWEIKTARRNAPSPVPRTDDINHLNVDERLMDIHMDTMSSRNRALSETHTL